VVKWAALPWAQGIKDLPLSASKGVFYANRQHESELNLEKIATEGYKNLIKTINQRLQGSWNIDSDTTPVLVRERDKFLIPTFMSNCI